MYNLSEQQIEFILNDIRRNGVKMEDLQLNLLDHICCIIEQNLKDGDDFESYYQQTVSQFYKNQLYEIEEETITLLTIKNYYVMKKSMILSGTISVATFIIGSFLKIMYWPGANVLLFLAIITLTFIFLPILFFIKSKEASNKKDKWLIAAAVLTGMLYATSSLFSVMHWPGRTPLWISTSAVSMFVLVPIYFLAGIKNELNKTNTIATTIILIGATGILFLQTSIRPGKPVELCNFYANQDIASTEKFISDQNSILFKKLSTDSTSYTKQLVILHQKSNELCDKIEKLKLDMINVFDGREDKNIDYSTLFSPSLTGHVRSTKFLFDDNNQPKAYLLELRKDVDNFNTFIKENFKINSFGMLITNSSFEMDGDGTPVKWEVFNFYKVPFDVVLRNLTQLQLDIRIAETTSLK